MTQLALPYPIPRQWSPAAAEAIEDNFRRLYGSSGRLGTGGTLFTNGLDALNPVPGDLIICTATGVFALLPIVTTPQLVLTNNGGAPTWALVDLATGITGKLVYANIQDISATQRVLGRNSASSGVIEEVTLSQFLDWVGSAAQGDLLYRGASAWTRIAAGTAGYFLQTAGASANPVWGPATGGASPLRSAIQFALFVTAGGVYTADGPFQANAGTINALSTAKPAAAFAEGFYWEAKTGTTASNTANYIPPTGGTGPINFTWDFDVSCVMRTDITAITGNRYWFVIGASSAPGNVDTLGSAGIGFRYSTVAGDAGWIGITNDGTQSATASVANIAINTRYVLRIRKVSGTVFFSVNGGAEVSTSTHVPTSDTYCTPVAAVYNTAGGAGSARSFFLSRIFGDIGT